MEYLKLFFILYVLVRMPRLIRTTKKSKLFHALSLTGCMSDSLYEIGTKELGDLSRCIIVRRCKCCGDITWSDRDTLKNRFLDVWNGNYLKNVDACQYAFYLKRKQQMRDEPQIYNGYYDDGKPDLTEGEYNASRF